MGSGDQEHWDERYRTAPVRSDVGLPDTFAPFASLFRNATDAIEIACGVGRASVWLAQQGLDVVGYDISPVAIAHAQELAASNGVSDTCRFEAADFDHGLPAGPSVDLVLCHMFRDATLDHALVARLRSGGTLAIAALSEVGASPGRFRVGPAALTSAFDACEILAHGEGDGVAWLVATKT